MSENDLQKHQQIAISLTRKLIRSEAKSRALEMILDQIVTQAKLDPESVRNGLKIQEALELNGAFRDASSYDKNLAGNLDDRTPEEMTFFLEAEEKLNVQEEDQ